MIVNLLGIQTPPAQITLTLHNLGNALAKSLGWYIYNGVKHDFISDIVGYDEVFTISIPLGCSEAFLIGAYLYGEILMASCGVHFVKPMTNKCVELTGNVLLANCREVPCNNLGNGICNSGCGTTCVRSCNTVCTTTRSNSCNMLLNSYNYNNVGCNSVLLGSYC